MLSTKYKVSRRSCQSRVLTWQVCWKSLALGPVGFLLLHLAVGIAAALQRLQRLLQGLGHIAVIDHAAPQIDDLVDVLDQQRAFFLASAAGRARPDFVFGINAACCRSVACRCSRCQNRIMLEGVIPGLDGEEPWRQRPPHRVGGTVVRTATAIGAGIEVEHVLPGEIFERLHAEGFHLIELLVADAPSHWLESSAVQLREVNVEERGFHVELNSKRPVAEQEVKGQLMQKIGAEVEVPESGQGS